MVYILHIIESVDSNMGIVRTWNIWQYNKSLKISKTVSLYALITTYHSSPSIFMTKKTPSGARKYREGTKPGTRKTGQMFFFFLQTDYLNTVLTSHAGLRTKQQHFLRSSAQPHCFFTTSKSHKAHVSTQTLRLPIWDAIFFICTYACTLKDHLATTRNCYPRSLN